MLDARLLIEDPGLVRRRAVGCRQHPSSHLRDALIIQVLFELDLQSADVGSPKRPRRTPSLAHSRGYTHTCIPYRQPTTPQSEDIQNEAGDLESRVAEPHCCQHPPSPLLGAQSSLLGPAHCLVQLETCSSSGCLGFRSTGSGGGAGWTYRRASSCLCRRPSRFV